MKDLDELDRLHAAATAGTIVALHNAWPEVSARLRAAEAEVERLRAALHRLVAAVTARGGDCPSCGVDDSDLCSADCDVNAARAALGEP